MLPKSEYDWGMIGGDLRQVYLANLLADQGFRVTIYGLHSAHLSEKCTISKSLQDAVAKSSKVLGPIPLSQDQTTIYSNAPREDLNLANLMRYLKKGKQLVAGCISEEFKIACRDKEVLVHDFMQTQALTIFNTIATAEGAISEAMQHHPCNIHGSECLVLGYGRCAKTLAHKLAGLSAQITLCARSTEALLEADALGYRTVPLNKLPVFLESFEIIFNTIPSLILDRHMLTLIKKDAIVIDIASLPGGVDYEMAKNLGVRAHSCLGLPGKYSPKSTAIALSDTLLKICK